MASSNVLECLRMKLFSFRTVSDGIVTSIRDKNVQDVQNAQDIRRRKMQDERRGNFELQCFEMLDVDGCHMLKRAQFK